MPATADVFAAIADSTRRQIFEQLAASGSSTATALAGDLSISRQAVAKHLAILADAGLATSKKAGRETRFEAEPGGLSELHAWVRTVEGEWNQRLAALTKSVAKSET